MLHVLKLLESRQVDEVYGSAALGKAPPKRRIPEQEMPPFDAYQLVHDEVGLDGNSRLNLATFCQTWVEPEVHRLMNECIDKNVIDKDEYPQTAELEARCAHIVGDLWHAPETGHPIGTSTTGSSEAAMLGGMAAKWRWRARMQAAGKPTGKPNFVCGPVQICWHKFARYLEVEMRQVPMEKGRLMLTPEEAVARCDENTIAVVPTLGVTYTLQYEPVEAIARALDDLQRRSGLDVPIHVDGASGGFLAPFLTPELRWDFRLPRVRSINASGHKFGLSPLGCGWIVWRSMDDLPEDLIFRVNYLGGDMPTFALNFSRPGGQVVAQYYDFLRLGREGYTRIHRSCAETAAWLSDQIAALGPFSVIPRRTRRHPRLHLDAARGCRSAVQPLRPGRQGALARLAGARLLASGQRDLAGRATRSGQERLLARHGGPLPAGLEAGDGAAGEAPARPLARRERGGLVQAHVTVEP